MANPQYSLSVTEGTELQLSLLGPQGPQGAPGPNTVTTATTTTITGLLKGNGSTVLAATAGTDYAAAIHTHTTADITDATSDGQTNPGKLLKTDANGALQIEELTLGNATTQGVLQLHDGNGNDLELATASLTGPQNIQFPDASGTIMVGANNLSDLSSASTARTNLGLGTGDNVTFASITTPGSITTTNLILAANASLTFVSGSYRFNYFGGSVAIINLSATRTLALRSNGGISWSVDGNANGTQALGLMLLDTSTLQINNGTSGTFLDLKLRNLIATQYLEGAEMTAPAAPPANGYRIFAEDNGSGKTRLMVQFATGAAQQIAIEP